MLDRRRNTIKNSNTIEKQETAQVALSGYTDIPGAYREEVAGLLVATCPHCGREFGPFDATDVEQVDTLRTEVAVHLEEHGEKVVVGNDGTIDVSEAVEEEAIATNVRPCVCGFIGKNGKEAGAHKRSCKTWKAYKAPKPIEAPTPVEPEPEPVAVPAPPEVAPVPQGREALWQVLNSIFTLRDTASSAASRDAQHYKSIEEERALLQQYKEVLPELKELSSLGYISKQQYSLIVRAYNELRKELTLETIQNPSYIRGKVALDKIEEKRLKRVQNSSAIARSHNSEYQDAVNADATAWKEQELVRYNRFLRGSLRVLNSTEDAVTIISDANRTVSSHVGKLVRAKAFELSQEFGICKDAATTLLKGLGFKSAKTFTKRAVRQDVDTDGEIITSKYTYEATESLPLESWANEIAKVVQYCRRQYRKAEMSTDEVMETQAFAKQFGFNLEKAGPEEPAKVRWTKSKDTNPDGSKISETTMEAALRKGMEKAEKAAEEALRHDADGDPNMESPA